MNKKTITKIYKIHASRDSVWQSLTNSGDIAVWSEDTNVTMNDQVGTLFSLWSGEITGKNIEIDPGQKLVQEWRSGDWKEDTISTVTFTLTEKDGYVEVTLVHEGIPEVAIPSIDDGWDAYYMEPLKAYVEKQG